MKLRIKDATIKELNWYPTEDDHGKFVLVWQAPLHKSTAEKLRCKGHCFDEQGVSRPFDGSLSLVLDIRGSLVELGDFIYECPQAHAFKVTHTKAKDDNAIPLELTGRMHFEGAYESLSIWCRKQNKDKFSFAIQPSQGELFEDDNEPVEAQLDNATTTAPKSAGSVASSRQMALATAAPGKKADKPN